MIFTFCIFLSVLSNHFWTFSEVFAKVSQISRIPRTIPRAKEVIITRITAGDRFSPTHGGSGGLKEETRAHQGKNFTFRDPRDNPDEKRNCQAEKNNKEKSLHHLSKNDEHTGEWSHHRNIRLICEEKNICLVRGRRQTILRLTPKAGTNPGGRMYIPFDSYDSGI